jgi:hypothetical protein
MHFFRRYDIGIYGYDLAPDDVAVFVDCDYVPLADDALFDGDDGSFV